MFESSWLPLIIICRFLLIVLWISLTISFVSSHFPFPFGCFGISCHTFLAIFSSSCDAMLGSYIMYFSSCFALVLWMQSKDSCCELLCAVSRILVLQLCDLLLPTLLNDGVYFALILESFLGAFCMTEWKRGRGRDAVVHVVKSRMLRIMSLQN